MGNLNSQEKKTRERGVGRSMNGFRIRTVSLLVILCSLFGYNAVLDRREKEEEYAQFRVEVETLEGYLQSIQEEIAAASLQEGIQEEGDQEAVIQDEGIYTDGEWEGEAQGFGGPMAVRVTVRQGTITDITIVSAEKEDQAYLSMAEDMIPAIIEAQSADVDTVTGATFSSTGIRDAAAQALEKAEK